jgi:ATP-dependent 26S proteasome regulatory subunit
MENLNSISPLLFMLLSKNNNDKNDKNKDCYTYYFSFLIILIPIISKLLENTDFKSLFSRKNNMISMYITSHEVPLVRACAPTIKTVYSESFLSIVYYLNTNNIKVKTKTEILSFSSDLAYTYAEREKGIDSYIQAPLGNEEFVIFTNRNGIPVYCKFEDLEVSNEENNDKTKKDINTSKRKKFIITLFIKSTDETKIQLIESFIEKCKNDYTKFMNKKLYEKNQYIFEYINLEKEDSVPILKFKEHELINNKDLNKNIFFEGKKSLINYINPFVYNPDLDDDYISKPEEKYIRCGFTFKAGILFYGTPGCGKTSTIKAILNYTKRHAIIINLSKIKTNEELEAVFRNRTINGRKLKGKQLCFILEDCDATENSIICSRKIIEDKSKQTDVNNNNNNDTELGALNKLLETVVDSTSKSDSNLKTFLKCEDSVNLSCFLNILDGIIELHGVMIIMSTNYPERIDDALIRPGRFDFKHEFKKASKKIVIDMLKISNELSNEEFEVYANDLDIRDYELSPAEVQSICFKNNNIKDCINEINKTVKK